MEMINGNDGGVVNTDGWLSSELMMIDMYYRRHGPGLDAPTELPSEVPTDPLCT